MSRLNRNDYAHYVYRRLGYSKNFPVTLTVGTRKIVGMSTPKALCGKRWVPFDNVDNLPICPECDYIRLRNQMLAK